MRWYICYRTKNPGEEWVTGHVIYERDVPTFVYGLVKEGVEVQVLFATEYNGSFGNGRPDWWIQDSGW